MLHTKEAETAAKVVIKDISGATDKNIIYLVGPEEGGEGSDAAESEKVQQNIFFC